MGTFFFFLSFEVGGGGCGLIEWWVHIRLVVGDMDDLLEVEGLPWRKLVGD